MIQFITVYSFLFFCRCFPFLFRHYMFGRVNLVGKNKAVEPKRFDPSRGTRPNNRPAQVYILINHTKWSGNLFFAQCKERKRVKKNCTTKIIMRKGKTGRRLVRTGGTKPIPEPYAGTAWRCALETIGRVCVSVSVLVLSFFWYLDRHLDRKRAVGGTLPPFTGIRFTGQVKHLKTQKYETPAYDGPWILPACLRTDSPNLPCTSHFPPTERQRGQNPRMN